MKSFAVQIGLKKSLKLTRYILDCDKLMHVNRYYPPWCLFVIVTGTILLIKFPLTKQIHLLKSFIDRSFLRYQIKRNEGRNGNCYRNSGIGVIEHCSVIYAKLRCRLNLLLTFDGTYWWQQTARLDSALQNSTYSATDQACVCADAALNTQVLIYVQSSCSLKEQLSKGHPMMILGFTKNSQLTTLQKVMAFGQDIWKVPSDSISKTIFVRLPYTSRWNTRDCTAQAVSVVLSFE